MKEKKVEIVAIIDKSGSMDSIKEDAIGGFNSFLNDQKMVDGEADFTLVLFDDQYNMLIDGKDIQKVEPLNEKTYRPSGMTALLDAVGRTIDRVGERLDETPEEEKPSKVIFFILTDGLENSSSDYSRERIKEMIEHQESKYSWEFIYGGANQDAFAEAGSLGIRGANTMNFASTGKGVRNAYMSNSALVTSYRTGTPSDEDQKLEAEIDNG